MTTHEEQACVTHLTATVGLVLRQHSHAMPA